MFGALLILLSVGHCVAQSGYAPQVHKLDLAVDPLHRYDKIVPLYMNAVKELIAGFKKMIPSIAFDIITFVSGNLDRFITQPYADEIRGLSAQSGVPVGDIVMLNLFYDIVAGCTSILAYNQQNKSVTHGRNLDFGIPNLSPVTVRFDVERNGTYLYTFTTFAGYVGILTGMKPNTGSATGWTFSLDERNPLGLPISIFENVGESLLRGGVAATLHVRQMMDGTGTNSEFSFNSAVVELTRVHVIAPSYLIVGGSDDGVVITRDRNTAVDVWRLPKDGHPPALVETNYDHWLPAPARDNRRDPAYRRLNETTSRAYGPTFLFERVMMLGPNWNRQTVYTTVMEILTKTYRTIVWPNAI